MSSLKHWAEKLVMMLKTAIKNNPTDLLIQQNNQPRLANSNPTNRNPALAPALAPPSCI